jgi:hypothetical protein
MRNILFVPGWMRNGSSVSSYNSIEIWQDNVDESKIKADILVGYSGAAFFCLNYWEKHPQTKLVLVNPLLPKLSFFSWMSKWFKTHLKEGIKNFGDILPLKYLWFNLKKFWQFSKTDALSVIKKIPKENLVILKGEKDLFCSNVILQELGDLGYEVKILENEGHNWSEKFSLELKKYL